MVLQATCCGSDSMGMPSSGAKALLCHTLCLLLWECQEKLQLVLTPKEADHLVLKWAHFTVPTDAAGASAHLGGVTERGQDRCHTLEARGGPARP